jgi:TRAP-type C4-dicarboxylate transport system permease small subunit
MKKAERIVRSIIEASGILATLILLVLMMITVCDVLLRALFDKPITGSTEISCMAMVCVVFFGIAWCALKGEHIRVDIISSRLSRKSLIILDSVDNIVTMVLALIIAVQCYSQAMFARQMGLKSLMLAIPRYPFVMVTAFGFFLLFIAMIVLQAT